MRRSLVWWKYIDVSDDVLHFQEPEPEPEGSRIPGNARKFATHYPVTSQKTAIFMEVQRTVPPNCYYLHGVAFHKTIIQSPTIVRTLGLIAFTELRN